MAKRLATMRLAEMGLRVGFQVFALPLGLFDYHLPEMELVADVARDYYSNDLRGGEGHMEVGKLIVNAVKAKANLTVSVKPFGCMPSSGVSDGVQTLITARYPGTIFCAVETSGDGATNFYSRIQMYMFKARLVAEEELRRAYADTGLTEAEVRAFLARNPRFAGPLHHAPHKVASSAANLVYEVAPLIKESRLERAQKKVRSSVSTAARLLASAPAKVSAVAAAARNPELRERLRPAACVLELSRRDEPLSGLRELSLRALWSRVRRAAQEGSDGERGQRDKAAWRAGRTQAGS